MSSGKKSKIRDLKSKGQLTSLALKKFSSTPPLAETCAGHWKNESGLPENLRGKCSAPLRELEFSTARGTAAWPPRKSVFKTRLLRSLPAPKKFRLGAGIVGKSFSARSAINKTSGRCKISRRRSCAGTRGVDSTFELTGRGPTRRQRAAARRTDAFAKKFGPRFLRRRVGLLVARPAMNFSGCISAAHGLEISRPASGKSSAATSSRWPRIGWRQKIWLQKLKTGARRKFRRKKLSASLHEIFQVERDEFWSWPLDIQIGAHDKTTSRYWGETACSPIWR